MRTVALEEHFLTAGLAAAGRQPWHPGLRDVLLDLGPGRLAEMDAAGIDVQVISHVAPAAQELRGAEAAQAARRANDQLAAAVASHPGRLAGFATLPTGDPAAAADELERAVSDLGFVGALVNSTLGTNGAFLDDARFEPLLARFEQLDVPLYLHPAPPPAELHEILFGGLAEPLAGRLATAAWGWHSEAGLHALRMVTAGVFDRHPGLRMIIGHCGEMIPFMLDRIDRILHGLTGLALSPSEYFLRNVWVTTAGMFSLPPVMCTVAVFGVDRVLFSVDYPFGSNQDGRKLLDMLPLSPADRAKIAGGNAERVLRLPLPPAVQRLSVRGQGRQVRRLTALPACAGPIDEGEEPASVRYDRRVRRTVATSGAARAGSRGRPAACSRCRPGCAGRRPGTARAAGPARPGRARHRGRDRAARRARRPRR